MTLDELIEDLTDRILITHDRDDHGHWSFGELPTDAAARIQAYADACVAEAQRWIPVSDRLPKKGEIVLWWSNSVQDQSSCYRGFYVNGHDPEILIVWYGDDLFSWDRLTYFTHWQPLPPAPTAERLT